MKKKLAIAAACFALSVFSASAKAEGDEYWNLILSSVGKSNQTIYFTGQEKKSCVRVRTDLAKEQKVFALPVSKYELEKTLKGGVSLEWMLEDKIYVLQAIQSKDQLMGALAYKTIGIDKIVSVVLKGNVGLSSELYETSNDDVTSFGNHPGVRAFTFTSAELANMERYYAQLQREKEADPTKWLADLEERISALEEEGDFDEEYGECPPDSTPGGNTGSGSGGSNNGGSDGGGSGGGGSNEGDSGN